MDVQNKFKILVSSAIFVFCVTAEAGTLSRSSSLFFKPTEASQQIKVLNAGSAVRVTGEAKQADDLSWLPVEQGDLRGWVLDSAVNLTEGDVGYVDPQTATDSVSRLNIWGSVGPTAVSTNAMNWGARVAAGVNALLGSQRQWILGFSVSHTFDGETISGNYASNIHRTTFLPTIGYYFVPNLFYAKAMAGLSLVNSDNTLLGTNIEPTFGAGLGFKVWQEKKFSLSVEGDYEFIETDAGGIGSAIGNAVGAALTGGNPAADPTSIIPKSNIYSVNLVFGFDL